MVGDLLNPPPRISAGAFDHVIANPPYLDRARANEVTNVGRAEATIEGDAELGDWIRFALTMVKPKGTVTFIHRADRIDGLLGQIAGKARLWCSRCGRGRGGRRAASSCARENRSPHRRGWRSASCCTSPTAGSRTRPKRCCAAVMRCNFDLSFRGIAQR
jgi:hypothetical protein